MDLAAYPADRSMVVNHLRVPGHNNIGVACIYLNHKETETQSPTNLLASLWKQLIVGKPVPAVVHKLYKPHLDQGTRPLLDEVLKILQSAIAEYSKVYFIVDALDEYPEIPRNAFLESLSTMMVGTVPVNLMLTSRPHIALDHFHVKVPTLEIRAAEGDIRRYVEINIRKSPRLSRHVGTHPDLLDEVRSNIVQNVQGM